MTVPGKIEHIPGKMREYDCKNPADHPCVFQRKSAVSETDLQGGTPVGLVHRDFKPWNVKEGQTPLFFDFEAASFDGCPLEDWFNYGTDPAIRVLPLEMTAELLRTKLNAGAVQILKQLELPETELPRYRRWYLLERYVFWEKLGQTELAEKFLHVYKITESVQ